MQEGRRGGRRSSERNHCWCSAWPWLKKSEHHSTTMAHHRNYHLYSRRKKAFFDPDEIKPWTFYSWQKYFAIAQLRDLGFLNCFFSSNCLSWKCLGTEMHFYIEVMVATRLWVDCVGESWNGRRERERLKSQNQVDVPLTEGSWRKGDRIFRKASIIQKGGWFLFAAQIYSLANWDLKISPFTMKTLPLVPRCFFTLK